MQYHYLRCTGKSPHFKCSQCSRQYESRTGLNYHMASSHGTHPVEEVKVGGWRRGCGRGQEEGVGQGEGGENRRREMEDGRSDSCFFKKMMLLFNMKFQFCSPESHNPWLSLLSLWPDPLPPSCGQA